MAKESKKGKKADKAHKTHGTLPVDLGFDWDPFQSLARLNMGWDPFRSAAFGRYPSRLLEYMNGGLAMPRVDIADNGDSFAVTADMPGVEKRDIKLTISDESITVRASRIQEQEKREKNFYSRERSSVGYYRVISMPAKIRRESAKAKYENGILRIDVKKAKGAGQGKNVTVE